MKYKIYSITWEGYVWRFIFKKGFLDFYSGDEKPPLELSLKTSRNLIKYRKCSSKQNQYRIELA